MKWCFFIKDGVFIRLFLCFIFECRKNFFRLKRILNFDIIIVYESQSLCSDHTTTGSYYESEAAIHGDYYNIHTGTDRNEGTHSNFRGYNKMADGVYEVVQYILNGADAPALMINIG